MKGDWFVPRWFVFSVVLRPSCVCECVCIYSSGSVQQCLILTLAMAVEAICRAASSRGWSRDISGRERTQKTVL